MWGGYSVRLYGCIPSCLNGLQETVGAVTASQNGSALVFTVATTVDTCSFSGTYSQVGKLGQVQGLYSCVSGTQGNFMLYEMTPTISGLTERIAGQNQTCQWSGYFGGFNTAP